MSGRLRFSVNVDGGLLVSPVGVRKCISLLLREESVELMYLSERPVDLTWESFGKIRSAMDGPVVDGWGISPFAAGRGGVMGVAVRVSGRFDLASHDLRRATMGWWRRFNQWPMGGALTGRLLPVLPVYHNISGRTRERDSLTALTTVLARRDDLRAALRDQVRVARLAHDLSQKLLPSRVDSI